MGLCRCPKRKVTTQFCYEHRVNVCESCMVENHPNVSGGPIKCPNESTNKVLLELKTARFINQCNYAPLPKWFCFETSRVLFMHRVVSNIGSNLIGAETSLGLKAPPTQYNCIYCLKKKKKLKIWAFFKHQTESISYTIFQFLLPGFVTSLESRIPK